MIIAVALFEIPKIEFSHLGFDRAKVVTFDQPWPDHCSGHFFQKYKARIGGTQFDLYLYCILYTSLFSFAQQPTENWEELWQ